MDNFEYTFTDTAVVAKAINPIEIDILKKDKIYEKETSKIVSSDFTQENENSYRQNAHLLLAVF